jgi:DNA-binding response OmpR family regulator
MEPTKNKLAWYVDDDQEMIEAISLLMKLLDFKVRPFLNAKTAGRAFLSGQRPDLLLLDINMPNVTGIDMLEFVRTRTELKNLPVIMLSSEDTDLQINEALNLGADGYIMKPATIEELEGAIEKAFDKHGVT